MSWKLMLRVAYLIVSMMSLPGYATAMYVAYSFEGTIRSVASVDPAFGLHPEVGSAVTGSLSYDTALAPVQVVPADCGINPCPPGTPPFFARYEVSAPYAINVTIDGNTITSSGHYSILMTQGDGGGSVLEFLAKPAMVNGAQTSDGVFGFGFLSGDPHLFAPSLTLPDHLNLDDFPEFAGGGMSRDGLTNDTLIAFNITSLTFVPLPGAGIMLLTGLGILARVAQRKGQTVFVR